MKNLHLSKNILAICVAILWVPSILFSQHGVSPQWSDPVVLPRYNEALNAKQRGVLYNNIVTTSNGRIIISTSEVNPSNINQLYGHYLTYSDDGGISWSSPIRFTPTDLVIGGTSVKLAIDNDDTLYVLWNSVNPSAIFISILDKDLNIIKDSIRVANKQTYGNFATHFTIDRKNRIHVMWHEGNPGTSNTAESFYTRSTDGGRIWQSPIPLSTNDGRHSAFPHAQFDFAGDTLAIAWRDSVSTTLKWDVYIVYSTNGGQSWSSPNPVISGIDSDWDPDILIDPFNRIHLFYTKYPQGNPHGGARNYYKYSDNVGATWSLPTPPGDGMFSAPYRSQLIEGTRYDAIRNVLFVTWKDERDFDYSTGAVKGDIMLAYSTNRGSTWSTPEFITDHYDSTVGFKGGALLPNGEYCINYELISQDDITNPSTFLRVYFRKRQAVPTNVAGDQRIPESFQLFQNYPNPFNPSTTIRFSLSRTEHVTLKVFSILGNEVATLVDGEMTDGEHSVVFDAKELPSGVYFYQLKTSNFVQRRKMVMVR